MGDQEGVATTCSRGCREKKAKKGREMCGSGERQPGVKAFAIKHGERAVPSIFKNLMRGREAMRERRTLELLTGQAGVEGSRGQPEDQDRVSNRGDVGVCQGPHGQAGA